MSPEVNALEEPDFVGTRDCSGVTKPCIACEDFLASGDYAWAAAHGETTGYLPDRDHSGGVVESAARQFL